MKEILCGAMAAVMTVSLAGCAKSESDTTATAETTSAEATVAQAGSSYTGTVTAVSAVSLTVETESDGEVTVTVGSYSTNAGHLWYNGEKYAIGVVSHVKNRKIVAAEMDGSGCRQFISICQ